MNNAALQMAHKSTTDIPTEEIERVFRTNIIAHFFLGQSAVLPPPRLGHPTSVGGVPSFPRSSSTRGDEGSDRETCTGVVAL